MPDSAALSVLVLAWDEAAPAVRTVIEAAPAVGSLLVLLPPAALAPPAPTVPPPAPAAMAPVPPTAEPLSSAGPAAYQRTAPTTPPTAAAPVVPPPAPAVVAPAAQALEATTADTVPRATTAVVTTAAATRPAVRVVHLSASPAPTRPRAGAVQVPAAPYLGATPATRAAEAPSAALTLDFIPGGQLPASDTTALGVSQPTAHPAATQGLAELPATAATVSDVPGEAAAAATAAVEAVAAAEPLPPATVPAPEVAAQLEAAAAPLADMAFRADEIIDPDPLQELQALPAELPAATPADAPVLSDRPPAPRHGPFGLRIPELATDAPATPAPSLPSPPDAEEDVLTPDEPTAPVPQYTAPNLNTQIIQYARQAVPTALASGPFEVLYAPAWPTWLAAVELRQRAGCPLVLHLPALAAGRQPADTAAGWPAEVQRQGLRQADLVLVETPTLARRLRRELGLPHSVVRVVPAHDAGAIARALRRARRR